MNRILIADDHQIVRRGLQELLSSAFPECTVGEARDSREAVDLLASQSWDLVLLDVNMPGRSGLEVLEDARRLCPQTPVLVLSAYPEEEFAMRAFKLGAAGYLNKQSACDELVVAVRKVLAGGRYVTASMAERLAASLGGGLEQAPHESLSSRELQVLRLVATGKTLKEVAAELALSEKTVGTYRARIAEKTGLSSSVQLARYAMRHKLVD
ncbi:MAG: response regulator transcription factor [Verrucomicrobiales bacterium]|nr:response regulator transcription factor [Verrucomicrobiales bacterium]